MPRSTGTQPDYLLAAIVIGLLMFGLMMLGSAGAVVGFERFGDAAFFMKQQALSAAIGLVALFICARIDYRVWRKLAIPLLAISLFLLLIVLLPGVGFESGGARRWITIAGFSLQPSEVTKLTFVMYLSVWLERRGAGIRDFTYGFLPFLALLFIIIGLIMLQPDLGTVSVIVLLSVVVYFVGGARLRHLALFGIGMASIFALLIKMAPYRVARFTVFLNPELDPQGIGYHINQALLAIGSGGLFGVGLGHSRQKYNYLPEVTNDSIFAVVAEELGFIVAMGVILLFLLLLRRGVVIARSAPDTFGKLLASAITVGIVGQAAINMSAISGLFPLTGVTLPFISFGGSSLIVTLASVGILLNISRHRKNS